MSEEEPRRGQKTVKSVRPWGEVTMVVRNLPCSVDLTHVLPGRRASLHSHDGRYELFHFIDAGGVLELDGEVSHPKPGDEVLIAPRVRHRFWAEEKDFHMLVVSFGEWKAEDQVRHEDDYGRAGKTVVL